MIESRQCESMYEVDDWLKRIAAKYRILQFQVIPDGYRFFVFVLIEREKFDEGVPT